ncbi:PHP domain-containing protein [Desulfitibacter alkalitolerans]|uniref:PHP domain-containing protein n=1 Tax=Desulfitibacter alkalitolerans TaxID=264641 RepID=UPI000481AB70|nr:PHP domain-containing protein [Desulfitibacter alkalitolerans]
MGADLHVHTTASDGTLKPGQCIKMAVSLGLEAISITDHDTVGGLEEAFQEAIKYPGFTFVPGIEISTDYYNTEVHVLGYYINHNCKSLNDFLQEMRLEREERCKKIINRLKSIGVNVFYEDLKNYTKEGTIGRPHIAQLIVKSGYGVNLQDAFDKYLVKGRPAYVPRKKITPAQAIEIVNKARGLPVLAHPIFLGNRKQIINVLEQGFIGVEVEYPNQSLEFKTWLTLKAHKMGLVTTGGSDFHGDIKGTQLGDFKVGFSIVKQLQKLKRERN